MTICPLAPVTEPSNVEAQLLNTQISCFDLNENLDVEITYSQIQDDVFSGKKYYEYDTRPQYGDSRDKTPKSIWKWGYV